VLTSGKQYEELLIHLSKNIEIKGFVYLRNPVVDEENDEKHLELTGLLNIVEQRNLLRKIPTSANPKDVQESFLAVLKKDGLEIPPLIPIICILGGPGSGKGTNCERLALDYGFRHISTGDLLRSYKEGQWFETINALMKDGKLVPSDMLLEIVKEEMDRYNYEGVYLLDGFPRNQENMDVWDKVMNGFASIDLYLYLECDEKVMESRLIGRSEVSGRLDDTPDIIMKRFRTFEKMTVPFIKETLAKSVDQVITVDATKPKEEVYKSIQEGLSAFGIKPIIKADKPSVLFILGGPGAGKGTQCEILVKDYGYKHLSTGDLLREEIKHKGPESASIEEYIKEGKLVPSTTLVKLMKNKIMNEGWSGHYLIDGTSVT
jgi:adenylate kinase